MEDLSSLKDYASQNSVPIMFDEGIEFIVNYIKENDVRFILEIGTAIGYSAIKFAQINPEIRIFTIEYDIERYQKAVENITKLILDDQITVFLGDALKFDFTEKFDLIFIDGAKSQYINFFEKYKNNLSENGVFISDNLFFHGMVENPELTQNYKGSFDGYLFEKDGIIEYKDYQFDYGYHRFIYNREFLKKFFANLIYRQSGIVVKE